MAASKYGSDTPTLQALTTAWPFSVTTSSRHVCSEGTAAVSDQLGRRRMAIAAQTRATPHLRPPSGSSRLLSRNRSNTIPKSKEPSFYVPVNLTKSAGSPCIAVNVRPDNNIDDHYQKVFSTTQQSANLAAVAVAVIESGPSPAPSSSTCTGSTTTSRKEDGIVHRADARLTVLTPHRGPRFMSTDRSPLDGQPSDRIQIPTCPMARWPMDVIWII